MNHEQWGVKLMQASMKLNLGSWGLVNVRLRVVFMGFESWIMGNDYEVVGNVGFEAWIVVRVFFVPKVRFSILFMYA